ncbi:hypothetical protein ACWV16_25165 [Achromobacter xylosoxidans]
MNDTTFKLKRRNLVATSAFVAAAAFLGLRVPSIAVGSFVEVAESPWKVWLLAAIIIIYQGWRYLTDDEITAELEACMTQYHTERHLLTAAHVQRATLAVLRGKFVFGTQIRIRGDGARIPPDSTDTCEVNYDAVTQDKVARFFKQAPGSGEVEVRIVRPDGHGGRDYLWSGHADFALGYCARKRVSLRAMRKALLRSPKVQDTFIPLLLGSIAFGFAFWRIAERVNAV